MIRCYVQSYPYTRGAKEGVQELVPDSKALNESWGHILALSPELQRAANRIENRDLVSLNSIPFLLAGGMTGDIKGLAAAGLASVLVNPKVSGNAAVFINKLGREGKLARFLSDSEHLSQAELLAYINEQVSKAESSEENKGIYH